MDIILKKAKEFADNYFMNSVAQYEELLDAVKSEVYGIDNPLDKIKYLNFLLDRNNTDYAEHKPRCPDGKNCRYNYAYENIAYYLTQELNRLGVQFNDDTFTAEEKDKQNQNLTKF